MVVGLGLASRAEGQVDPQPPISLAYSNLTAVRLNPLGLVDFASASLRLRLYESDSDALTQNFVGFGAVAALSPAWGRVGVLAEVQPLSVLLLYAQYEFIGYFGTFDLTASFPSASADYSDTSIDQRGSDPATDNYATTGSILTLGATLQLKVGPIAVRSLFRAVRTDYDLRSGDRVYYDQIYDILMPDEGWMVTNDVDVLGVFDIGSHALAAGARYSFTHSFYRDAHYLSAADHDTAPSNDVQRLGALVAWTVSKNPLGRFDRPTLILIAQWHLKHRWRTGQDVSTALPYLALAFSFRGDLLADH